MYLLTLSWLAIQFSLPQYNKFRHADPVIKFLAIFQSYLVLAAAFAVGIVAPDFGNTPTCNRAVSAVIFVAFPFYKGRVPLLVGLSAVTIGYTVLIVYDYRVEGGYSPTAPPTDEYTPPEPGSVAGSGIHRERAIHFTGGPMASHTHLGYAPHRGAARHVYMPEPRTRTRLRPLSMGFSPRTMTSLRTNISYSRINGRVLVTACLIVAFSVVIIANTELLILHNRPITTNVDWDWTFGQILPLFLAFLSGSDCVKVFVAYYASGPKP